MPAIKTVIYLDVLLLVNFLVAYFLLQAAGLLSSQHAAFSRMVCASGIASLSALICSRRNFHILPKFCTRY